MLVVHAAGAQSDSSPQNTPPQTHTRNTLGGVHVSLPNVLGSNKTPPLQRHNTLLGRAGNRGVIFAPIIVPYTNDSFNYFIPPNVYTNDGYTYSTGSYLNGSYNGDKFSLRLHIGSDPAALFYGFHDGSLYYNNYVYASPGYHAYVDGHGRYRVVPNIIRYVPYYPWYGVGYWGVGYYNPYANYNPYLGPIDGTLTQNQQLTYQIQQLQQQIATQQKQLDAKKVKRTLIERARDDHAHNNLDKAINEYREHLRQDNEDVTAMRDLALAMLEAGRLEDGAAMISLAYHTDPLLARTPIDFKAIGFTRQRYDRLLGRVMAFANRTNSPSSWLAGMVLLQSNNKMSGATRVLLKAKRAGLDDEIADAFERELGIPAHR